MHSVLFQILFQGLLSSFFTVMKTIVDKYMQRLLHSSVGGVVTFVDFGHVQSVRTVGGGFNNWFLHTVGKNNYFSTKNYRCSAVEQR